MCQASKGLYWGPALVTVEIDKNVTDIVRKDTDQLIIMIARTPPDMNIPSCQER